MAPMIDRHNRLRFWSTCCGGNKVFDRVPPEGDAEEVCSATGGDGTLDEFK